MTEQSRYDAQRSLNDARQHAEALDPGGAAGKHTPGRTTDTRRDGQPDRQPPWHGIVGPRPRQRRRSGTFPVVRPQGSMVKIPDRRKWTRTTAISFASMVAVAMSILIAWRLWHARPVLVATQRDISDVHVTWRCPSDHRFTALGATDSRPCPQCSLPADVAIGYHCGEHGEVELLLRYRPSADGRASPATYSVDGLEWAAMVDEPPCPACHEPLQRKRRLISASSPDSDTPG